MIVILKTTDTKLRAVLPGDRLVLKCRAQYEAVGAVLQSESFDSKKYETWEFDLCRSVSPQIGVSHE